MPGHPAVPIAAIAAEAEHAGWDSLWMSDHVLVPGDRTDYPYRRDGQLPVQPWLDCLVALSVAAGATQQINLGTCVLLMGLRDHVVTAKQLATLDILSGGRVVIGVGAGWLRVEYEALGVDFDKREATLDGAIATARKVWSGSWNDIPTDPRPAGPMPILIGGMSRAALRRAAHLGDGWLALQPADMLEPDQIAAGRVQLLHHGSGNPRIVLRIRGSVDPAIPHLPALQAAGVSEVVVDADWRRFDPADLLRRLRMSL